MPSAQMGTTEHPNLVFIQPDQWGALWTACYGHPDVQTPALDALAAEGVLFERAYTTYPLCTPYRSTLFTGRYACQTGVIENNVCLPRSVPSLADVLNQGGYLTSYVGKWHLSGLGERHRQGRGRRWVPSAYRGGFRQFIGWESEHVDHWDGVRWEDDPASPQEMPGHETDALTAIVCERLGELRHERFALFVGYQAPHPPCAPPEAYLSLYRGRTLNPRANWGADDIAYRVGEWGYSPRQREFVDAYFGEITHLDAAVGRILSSIQALGLAENTAVVLTSDHGELAGCHGLFGKGVMYEEATRVPLIARIPGGPQGLRYDGLFSAIDLMPTLVDLCGLPPPPSAEGMSFAPLLRGQRQAARHAAYIEYATPKEESSSQPHHLLCIVRGGHKLVTSRDDLHPLALYDLLQDPYELRNLVAAPELASLVEDLQHELAMWFADAQSRQGNLDEPYQLARALVV